MTAPSPFLVGRLEDLTCPLPLVPQFLDLVEADRHRISGASRPAKVVQLLVILARREPETCRHGRRARKGREVREESYGLPSHISSHQQHWCRLWHPIDR